MPELHRLKMDVRLVIRAYNDEHLADRINDLCNAVRKAIEEDDYQQSFDIFEWKEIPFEKG
jgi:siroheme synthase (precorrin-2 oxidase/ferrochelatase)